MWPIAFQLIKTALMGAVAVGVAYYIYSKQNNFDETPLRADERRRRGQNGETVSPILRKVIADKLNSGTYDCNICLDEISRHDEVVSCKKCYTINHLRCIRRHCASSEGSRRTPECPSCRKHIDYELEYYCFCGSELNPIPIEGVTPHCCLSKCNNCRLHCHPGPCADD
ncbi:uncharacterized protein [Halyomorpha halys]|uniref:uncharacterized protein isoform X2 n=1 Tax=Halyomorpha halys TaxID=286706 RepID=UPI0006D4E03E|nr:FKBP12-associated protein 1 homolog isoform X2 [Halyomorpha halys]